MSNSNSNNFVDISEVNFEFNDFNDFNDTTGWKYVNGNNFPILKGDKKYNYTSDNNSTLSLNQQYNESNEFVKKLNHDYVYTSYNEPVFKLSTSNIVSGIGFHSNISQLFLNLQDKLFLTGKKDNDGNIIHIGNGQFNNIICESINYIPLDDII